uniref:Ragulator complex protein LAMTOR1 n=2 Tax=Schistocephalus solidus TaxID=70667 RepID=A0A0X3P5S3_SCHSO
MGNFCCCKVSENEEDPQDAEAETQHLLHRESLSYSSTQPAEILPPSPKDNLSQMPDDMTTIMSDIIKGVENQVVDAGATDVNILEQHDYAARVVYYAEQLCDRIPLPTSAQNLPRAVGNPASILAAPSVTFADIQKVKEVAKHNAKLISEMCPQQKEDLIVQFDST